MPQREGGVLLRSRVANLRLKGVQQRMEQALVIAGHVVQGPAMPCSESSEGRISSSTPALGSSGRISGRASASFAASVLSHSFRSGANATTSAWKMAWLFRKQGPDRKSLVKYVDPHNTWR